MLFLFSQFYSFNIYIAVVINAFIVKDFSFEKCFINTFFTYFLNFVFNKISFKLDNRKYIVFFQTKVMND